MYGSKPFHMSEFKKVSCGMPCEAYSVCLYVSPSKAKIISSLPDRTQSERGLDLNQHMPGHEPGGITVSLPRNNKGIYV